MCGIKSKLALGPVGGDACPAQGGSLDAQGGTLDAPVAWKPCTVPGCRYVLSVGPLCVEHLRMQCQLAVCPQPSPAGPAAPVSAGCAGVVLAAVEGSGGRSGNNSSNNNSNTNHNGSNNSSSNNNSKSNNVSSARAERVPSNGGGADSPAASSGHGDGGAGDSADRCSQRRQQQQRCSLVHPAGTVMVDAVWHGSCGEAKLPPGSCATALGVDSAGAAAASRRSVHLLQLLAAPHGGCGTRANASVQGNALYASEDVYMGDMLRVAPVADGTMCVRAASPAHAPSGLAWALDLTRPDCLDARSLHFS